jgi:hypothetical protein
MLGSDGQIRERNWYRAVDSEITFRNGGGADSLLQGVKPIGGVVIHLQQTVPSKVKPTRRRK